MLSNLYIKYLFLLYYCYFDFYQRTVTNEPAPYSLCQQVDQTRNEELNFYADRYRYSKTACHYTCLQVHVIKQYQCCAIGIPCNPLGKSIMFGVPLPEGIARCGSPSYDDSSDEVIAFSDICQELCPPSCHETHYDTFLYSKTWPNPNDPSESALPDFKRVDNLSLLFDYVRSGVSVSENILGMEVFYDTLDVETLVSSPKYDLSVLLSNFGGTFGLFAGFSVLTVMELIELLIDILCYLCIRNKIKNIRKIADSSTQGVRHPPVTLEVIP